MKVLLAGGGTGGHLVPALALAEAILALRPDIEPVLVGAQRGIEAQVLPRYSLRHHLLPIEPIYRHQWWRNARWPLIAWRVWGAVGELLRDERPAVVIGTGGYAAGPVVWRAQRAGLPTVLQEQNAYPGITTRWLARRARQIHLGFPEARERLSPGSDTAVFALGNPIRAPQRGDRAGALAGFGLDARQPTVLVFGGSQGARALNFAVASALEHRQLADWNILWGTGAANEAAFARYGVPGRVALRGFFDPMAEAYRAADLVVCRAGAMTVAELCAWGLPSILVPLPSAAADHQTFNARAMTSAGAAVMVTEAALSGETLSRTLATLLADRARLAALSSAARSRGHPDAASEIVSKILTLI